MSAVGDHMHFVLALHVGHSERRVHPLCPRQEEHLLRLEAEKDRSEVLEPLAPEVFCRQEICSPHVLHCTCGLVCLWNYLGRHGDSGAFLIFYLAAEDAILDYRGQIWEGIRSVGHDLLHEGQSFHGRTLDHINDDNTEDALLNVRSCHFFL